ncbi:hypothetical protein F5Y13DRAFT_197035 [Hypoxylon sp. FL1857]|nr:hypothetical protein F5Y13DRAFT_197035 [Hypoxylon sp. FL1857]
MAAFALPITWGYSERSSYRLSCRGPRWALYGHNQERAAPASGPFIPRKNPRKPRKSPEKGFICASEDGRDLSNIPSPCLLPLLPAGDRLCSQMFMCAHVSQCEPVSLCEPVCPQVCVSMCVYACVYLCFATTVPSFSIEFHSCDGMVYGWWNWWNLAGSDTISAEKESRGLGCVFNMASSPEWSDSVGADGAEGDGILGDHHVVNVPVGAVAHSLKRQHIPAYLALLAKTLT